ncbi:chromosome segregation ATPase [Kitasatospora sp. GAS204A]|uniref:hypothetical protein n=1 Tax=unclassified Kitasatospora TaxID=2633591 RepID=UPI002474155D|nr:hypothetical protein [Kitasatospora sp. GAS204B]MDH6116855.1 chromosome segregation ATPase [Kitasatospora sp. GAS204B]
MNAALPPTSMDALREEVERLRVHLAEFVGHEPTIREEMGYLSRERMRLRSERDRARRIAVQLEQENARLHQVIGFLLTNPLQRMAMRVWTSDIDAMLGRVELADLGNDRTEITYQWLQDRLAAPDGAS